MFMARFLQPLFSIHFRKSAQWVLALAWISGLLLGGLVFRFAGSDLVSMMPLATVCQPSIFGLLASCLLPFLLSAFAVYIYAPGLLPAVCFLKAFLLCYISCGVLGAFGGSGWLVRVLLLFTDVCCCVLLYHYCHRHISGLRGFSPWTLGLYAGVLILVAGVDYSFISPLLRRFLS